MSTLSLEQLFREKDEFSVWMSRRGFLDFQIRHGDKESLPALASLEDNYRFRFCENESDAVKRTVEDTFLEAQKTEPRLRLGYACGSTEYSWNRSVTVKPGLLKKKEVLGLLQLNSWFRNRHYGLLRFYEPGETGVRLPELFARNLSETIDELNNERKRFEDGHRYDYEHEDKWLSPQRVVLHDSDHEKFKEVEPYSRTLWVTLDDKFDEPPEEWPAQM